MTTNNKHSALGAVFLGLLLATIFCPSVAAQSDVPAPIPVTGSEVWPEVDAHIQLLPSFRVLSFAGMQQGVGFPYQQWYAAAGLGYQFKPILKAHIKNIDPDKERYLVVAGGYEFFQTI